MLSSPVAKWNLLPHIEQHKPVCSLIQNFSGKWFCGDVLYVPIKISNWSFCHSCNINLCLCLSLWAASLVGSTGSRLSWIWECILLRSCKSDMLVTYDPLLCKKKNYIFQRSGVSICAILCGNSSAGTGWELRVSSRYLTSIWYESRSSESSKSGMNTE